MASVCKVCAKLNVGTRCMFCGNRLSSAPHSTSSVSSEQEPTAAPQEFEFHYPDPQSAAAEQRNPAAVAGLILSLLVYFAFFGFIFSIVGIVKSKKLNGKGQGVAVAGLVVSSVIMLAAAAFVLLVLWGTWDGLPPGQFLGWLIQKWFIRYHGAIG